MFVSGTCCCCGTFSLLRILLVELFDAPRRIEELLLSGIEGMAVLTNFDVQVAHC